jgi:hypothetical protein
MEPFDIKIECFGDQNHFQYKHFLFALEFDHPLSPLHQNRL